MPGIAIQASAQEMEDVTANGAVSDNAVVLEDDTEIIDEEVIESPVFIHIKQKQISGVEDTLEEVEVEPDQPVILAEGTALLLSAEWSAEVEFDTSIVWRILRAESGTEAGTTNLSREEDDWTDFEEVKDSTYFSVEKIENENVYSELSIVANELTDKDGYDYYIRIEADYSVNQDKGTAITTIPVIIEYTEADKLTKEGQMTDVLSGEEIITGELAQGELLNEALMGDILEEKVKTEEVETLNEDIISQKAVGDVTPVLTIETTPDVITGTAVTPKTVSEPNLPQDILPISEIGTEQTDAEKNNDYPTDEEGNILAVSDEIWIAGFERESENLCYTGDKVTQNLRVYHEGTLLKEGRDYTLTYKNNINAATYDDSRAPSVKIRMRGQYSGSQTLYFTIAPRDIGQACTYETEQIVYYRKKISIAKPCIYFGERKLSNNRDFVCDYSTLPENYKYGDSYEDGMVYQYKVNGVGNFTGSYAVKLSMVNDKNFDFHNAEVVLDKKEYAYVGEALTASDIQIISVKAGKVLLEPELYEYEVCANGAGIGYVHVYPSAEGKNNGYLGVKKLEINIVGDRDIQNAVLGNGWEETITFSGKQLETEGGFYQEETDVLIYVDGESNTPLTEGVDYTVSYRNNKGVGWADVVFTGIGRYKGILCKAYEIVPNVNLSIEWNQTDGDGLPVASYTKGGVIPDFRLIESQGTDSAHVLKDKTDYIIRTRNNQNLGFMTCEIIGKGDYKGYKYTAEVEIIPGDISDGILAANDRIYSEEENDWKASVVITDVNGNKLKAGKDYSRELVYRYEGMTEESIPQPGTTVYVTANGINNYDGSSITGCYCICSKDISEVLVVIDEQEYTGEAIELSEEDIHVYATRSDAENSIELASDCYKIAEYSDNVKVGIAKVTLEGIGSYGGSKTFSFKILPKRYQTVRVSEVLLDKTEIFLGVGNSEKLTATILPEDAQNKTIIWKSSRKSVATVDEDGVVTAKKPGEVKIRAVSQDTGKTAVCSVTVEVIPVVSFSIKEDRINGGVGSKYQLTVEEIQPLGATLSTIMWESTASEIASVDENGMVSLHKPGMAVIKAHANEGQFVDKCLVIVEGGEESTPEVSYVTPQEFRECDDPNDTNAFHRAIRSLDENCNTVFVPAGVYKIDAEIGICPVSGMNLIMSPDAVLLALDNSDTHYNVIYVRDVSNVIISGGEIIGERYEHGDSEGEWGMGIGIYDSTNITVSNVEILDCWGDGIYIGSKHDNDLGAGSNIIKVSNCYLHNNRRNNLSIVCADYVTVDGCRIDDANGTAPEYGIDIEPNNSANPSEHIVISNCTFSGNKEAAMGIVKAANDVLISECTMNGLFVNWRGTNVELSNTTINGEMDARYGVTLTNGSVLNDGTDEPDILVATFQADKESYIFETYGIDESNQMSATLIPDESAFDKKALLIERTSEGNQQSGYHLNLKDFEGDMIALKPGTTYRYEYVVKGSGEWAIISNQTGWYSICPVKEYRTCYTTYKAKLATNCKILLYAEDYTNGMQLNVDSINIYEVR